MSAGLVRPDEGQAGQEPLLSLDYEYREEEVFQGARAVDLNNKMDTRRNFQAVGLMVVLWMFVPELMRSPNRVANWLMVVAAVVLIFLLWKAPDMNNRRFARLKAEGSPKVHLEFTPEGIEIWEGGAHYTAPYGKGTEICEFGQVFAASYEKGRVLVIPQSQLSPEQAERLRELLTDALGGPPKLVEEKMGWFSSRKGK